MAVLAACDNCGRSTPIYRLAAVVLDGRMARICPTCQASQENPDLRQRIAIPYAPRHDQGAIQPSTARDVW